MIVARSQAPREVPCLRDSEQWRDLAINVCALGDAVLVGEGATMTVQGNTSALSGVHRYRRTVLRTSLEEVTAWLHSQPKLEEHNATIRSETR